MAAAGDLTTLVCLFHNQGQAQAAIQDLLKSGVDRTAISVISHGATGNDEFGGSTLAELGVPERDRTHLQEGVSQGGMIVAVSATSDEAQRVEAIFGDHKASKIDDVAAERQGAPELAGTPLSTGATAIPIVEEELQVGKRSVDRGGVRLYRRIISIPVEEAVELREEHVNVERRAVDRPATEAELAARGDRTIELTEIAEEAVIGKTARVVEEVRVEKAVTERTQHIQDTVRRTEVDVEEVNRESAGFPSTRT